MDIFFKESGVGEYVILFLHGLGSTGSAWQSIVPALQQENLCVVLDLPGYGDSPPLRVGASLDKFAEAIEKLVSEMEYTNIILVGHSMGGQLAQLIAIRKKIDIKGMILLAPAGFERFSTAEKNWFHLFYRPTLIINQSKAQIKRNFFKNFHKSSPIAISLFKERLAISLNPARNRQYAEVTTALVHAMLATSVFDRLKQIKIPTYIFFGKNDALIPNRILHKGVTTAEIAHLGQSAIEGSHLHLLDDCGHFIQIEKPEEIIRGIRLLLEQLRNKEKTVSNAEILPSKKDEEKKSPYDLFKKIFDIFNHSKK